MAEPTKWAQKVAQVIYANMFDDTGNPLAPKEAVDQVALALDEARRQGIARLADPDDALLDRGLRVVTMAAAAGHITRVQMHDICQALADELEPADD